MAALYRVAWFLMMVLVMAPAFIFAGSVDGISHQEATDVLLGGMKDMFHFPYTMALCLSPVVAFFAQLFPASSIVAVMAGEMIWEHVGVIFTFLFFAFVRPPFYAEVERKYGAQEQTA
ncbi:UNVERIFIED_ORG: hypothetical protein J2W87_001417 [Pseudomonas putida]|nr:hypothetical protein [Pseudomonas putida]